jgi:hypothetical protein
VLGANGEQFKGMLRPAAGPSRKKGLETDPAILIAPYEKSIFSLRSQYTL